MKFDYDAMMCRYEIAKRERMIEQIDCDTITLFNARKSLFVEIKDSFIGRVVKFLLKIQIKRELRKLNGTNN